MISSILNRVLVDIFGTLIMALIELFIAFNIEDFYDKNTNTEYFMIEIENKNHYFTIYLGLKSLRVFRDLL